MNGVPEDWYTVEVWLDDSKTPLYPDAEVPELLERKFKNIPLLDDYSIIPEADFWVNFPSRALPTKACTRINSRNLEKLIEEHKPDMTNTELNRANKIVQDLKNGAEAYQRVELPPITVQNTRSALEHGALITDKLASWIEEGFVAGPFDCPPTAGFRANPLMAVVRNRKVRPVLNMSGPQGKSFNDNVMKDKLEKVNMDTAKTFGLGRCFRLI